MRSLVRALTVAMFAQAGAGAQIVNVNGGQSTLDARPFGKYLVQICEMTYWDPSAHTAGRLSCITPRSPVPPPFPPPPAYYTVSPAGQPTTQTITLKQAGCMPGTVPCPDPVYPLTLGTPFFVSATSDSGLPVTLQRLSGTVTAGPMADGVQQFVATALGTIVIQATQPGNAMYAPAVPVQLILTVQAVPDADGASSCKGLLPAAATTTQPQVDLPTIVTLMGNPNPFVLAVQGKQTLFVYSTRYPLTLNEEKVLQTIPSNVADLAARTQDSLGGAAAKAFKVELRIPHAAALGDLASRISSLNYTQFMVQNIGADMVRISAPSTPDCATWTAFLQAVRHLEWQAAPEPFEMKLFYVSASDAVTAFNGLSASPAAPSASGGSPAASSAPATGGAPSAAGNATIAVTQPPGSAIDIRSDTTPCVVAGLAFGSTNGCAPGTGSGSSGSGAGSASTAAASAGSGAAATAAPKPPSMAALGLPVSNGQQPIPDLLVFSGATPGDDGQILERKRILAQLDLPRPEMMINAWVMQNSTASPEAIGAFANTVRELVGNYNDAIELVVEKGWKTVKDRTQQPGYFDEAFYHYIADRFIADANSASTPKSAQEAAQKLLETSPGKIADSPEARTRKFGVCPETQYCLGYNFLFQPLKPRLTDFLLTLIAAVDAKGETLRAIRAVEPQARPIVDARGCDQGTRERRDHCSAIWTNLAMDREPPTDQQSCIVKDYVMILSSLLNPDASGKEVQPTGPAIFLRCFAQAANECLPNVGLLRAALADFLFNYKVSVQYPHEFYPYELSQSADTLNTALSPLIDAFNRDIVAFQTFMRADVQYQVDRLNRSSDQRCCVKRLLGLNKPSFFNDGLVTVRTISGQAAQVNTTSQSALNVSSAPNLSTLLNNIATPGGGSGTSPLAGVLGSGQPAASLLTGVLNSYQTTYAQIGRSLNLQVVPRSLSTASSAEINVTLNADETAGGPTYSGGPTGAAPPNLSRVATHDTTTRIRVESVKLFEVSSFAAILERSRSKFPLLPPFVEIPYIGTLLGIPIPGAKEYHSSIAVMSAVVVPTAADLAYGLRFAFDEVVDSPSGPCAMVKGSAGAGVTNACKYRIAVSIRDLNASPINRFHESMIRCLATDMLSPTPSFGSLTNMDKSACKNLTFDSAF
jgi:hypothetical protein